MNIIPFCDTQYQSLVIGVFSGLVTGTLAIRTGQLSVGLVSGAMLAIGLEIAAHEYRQDEQYRAAKSQLASLLSAN